MPRALRVAIDARIPHAQWGGVQQVVEGLAKGLGQVGGDDEYLFVTDRGGAEWLRPLLGENSRTAGVPRGYGRTVVRRLYDASADRLPVAARFVRAAASRLGAGAMQLPQSDGYLERLGVDLVHFATPQAYLTAVPSIYQPHDLLHRHFVEQFSPVHARYREHAYRTFCERATIVAVMTDFGRKDLIAAYDLPPDRVAVVPWAPIAGRGGASSARSVGVAPSLELPEQYVLYPAQTWPHKNHLRLVEALALLRDRGRIVSLVCTGRQTEHFRVIRRRIEELGVSSQVVFTGYVEPAQLEGLLAGASALVFPSLFEGWGLPVVEAFSAGIPVACSSSSALPEVAKGAALLFDPEQTDSIADALLRVLDDDGLRGELERRGRRRVGELSWATTASTFRAIYRLVARAGLSEEDRALLAPPTLLAMPKAAR